ncbi:MAG: glycosyltransferase [Bacteroidia bacterium]
MKLSVIIVNYNVKYFLQQALLSVLKAADYLKDSSGFDTEIWVVDNNSKDGSVELVQEHFPQVKLITNKDNTGFSFANNQAIKQSSGEYILLLNPDTVVPEDNFAKAVAFMDAHADAGGLGVRMLDGAGKFLPESKRGFPSPAVAFYKIFGFSKFFPKSRKFGKYHLGYLPENETHEVDVLAGAYMLLRKNALTQIGLLDEDFFMYGEDIDLSYRIVKSGYKNYYFPDSPIIHYKGESTKKGSINYVFVFYRAMVIFAKKHLPKDTASLFSLLINLAIYLRAGASIAMRFVQRLALPVLDFAALYGGMLLLVNYWERTIKYIDGGGYPDILTKFFVPLYIVLWIFGLFLFRGYQKPYLGKKILYGTAAGTLFIAVIYAFLSEDYRFSRALLILGTVLAVLIFSAIRLALALISPKKFSYAPNSPKKIAIVGSLEEGNRVSHILQQTKIPYTLVGLVNAEHSNAPNSSFIGSFAELEKVVGIYKIDELIYCADSISNKEIIASMESLNRTCVDFKIVPQNSQFIIGSNSKNEPGDYYSFETNFAINSKENKFNKRFFDVVSSLILLITLPLNFWFVRKTAKYINNLIHVLSGKKTWVGYADTSQNNGEILPHLPHNVLSPVDELPVSGIDDTTKQRLNFIYARDYTIYSDIAIFFKGFNKLGA